MAVHQFEVNQLLKADQKQVWDFISSPANLKEITPPYMGFHILSGNLPDQMYPGMIIKYTVRPVLSFPLNWVTEITHVKEGSYFVDEQRHGPYSFWHHQHHLRSTPDGVLMTDIVHYSIPFGILGDFLNSLVVKSKLKEIFDYRHKKLEQIYG